MLFSPRQHGETCGDTQPSGGQTTTRAEISDDALFEFLPELQEDAPSRITEIVPAFIPTDPIPARSPRVLRSSWCTRTANTFVALATDVFGTLLSRITRSVYATAHRGWDVARLAIRIAAPCERFNGLQRGRTTAWRRAGIFCSILGTRYLPRLITHVNALTSATIESTRQLRIVARFSADGAAHCCGVLLSAAAMRLPVWRAQINRIHRLRLNAPLASFGSGMAAGVVVMWWFGLQPAMNAVTSHEQLQLGSTETPSAPPQLAVSIHQSSVSREDPPRRPAVTRPGPAANATAISRRPAPPPGTRFRGTLTIASRPEGARVFINGQSVGATPLVLKAVPVGSRAVRIEAAGYQRWSSSVQVTANQQTQVMAKLDRVLVDTPKWVVPTN